MWEVDFCSCVQKTEARPTGAEKLFGGGGAGKPEMLECSEDQNCRSLRPAEKSIE